MHIIKPNPATDDQLKRLRSFRAICFVCAVLITGCEIVAFCNSPGKPLILVFGSLAALLSWLNFIFTTRRLRIHKRSDVRNEKKVL
jgi:hypothetical protein